MGNNTLRSKVFAVAVSAVTVVALSGLMPFAAHAQSNADLQAQITALLAQIAQLQAKLSAAPAAPAAGACSFTRDLTVGSKGDDVTCLQNALAAKGHLKVSATGYFGNLTKAAVAAWQKEGSISPSVGYFGSKSRAAYAASAAAPAAPAAPGAPAVVVPSGSGLAVTAKLAPAGLLPVSVASAPFMDVTFTAGSAPVTITGLKVMRVGSGQDAAFAGIIALDDQNRRMGQSQPLGSDHGTTLSMNIAVPAGSSKTITIAGDRGLAAACAGATCAGEQPALQLVSVTAGGANVTGLPITSNTMTINETLAIGVVTLTAGPLNPAAATKEVGTTGYTFTSVRAAIGAAESVLLKSVQWYQSGSAGASDLANVATVVDGVAYPTTVSADGKYYTSAINKTVEKGLFVEMSIKGDLISGSGRTARFDIYRYADLQTKGLVFGYDITPVAAAGCAAPAVGFCFQAANPNVVGVVTTAGAGSLNVSKASSVPSQVLSLTTPRQILGAFEFEAKGEPISISSLVFQLQSGAAGGAIGAATMTDIGLYDASGSVLTTSANAGVAACAAEGCVTLSSLNVPVGKNIYYLRGTLTGFSNGEALTASTTVVAAGAAPVAATGFAGVQGRTTGNVIVPTGGAVTGNTGTFRNASLAISIGTTPVAQTVVSGAQNFTFTQVVLDATNSGEPVGVTSIPMTLAIAGGAVNTHLTNCGMWDGATLLSSGSNLVNPVVGTAAYTYTLDSRLTIPAGGFKVLGLACNLAGNAVAGGSYMWGNTAAQIAAIGATALNSGLAVVPSGLFAAGNGMTAAGAGTLAVALDPSNPIAAIFAAGSSNVTVGVLRFTGTTEAIDLRRLSVRLSANAAYPDVASSSPANIVKYTLWDGATKVGEGVFPGTGSTATSTISNFVIGKDSYKLMTVKVDSTLIGTGQAAVAGQRVAIDFFADIVGAAATTYGVGASSGANITSASASTAAGGQLMHRSYPALTVLPLPTSTLSNGTKVLARLKVSANATGDIGLNKLTATFATTTVAANTTLVSGVNVYAYNDANFSQPSLTGNVDGAFLAANNGVLPGGMLANGTEIEFIPTNGVLQVPAGGSRYLEMRGTITGAAVGSSVQVTLVGDAAVVPLPAAIFLAPIATVDAAALPTTLDNFLWSPNSTTTSPVATNDWTNGFALNIPASLQIGFLSQ